MKKFFLWREDEAKNKNLPPNNIFKVNHISRLNDVIQRKDFKKVFLDHKKRRFKRKVLFQTSNDNFSLGDIFLFFYTFSLHL